MLITEDGRPLLTNFTNSSFVSPSSTWLGPRSALDSPSETGDMWDLGTTIVVRLSCNISATLHLIVISTGAVHASGISFLSPTSFHPTGSWRSGDTKPPKRQGDPIPYDGSVVGYMLQLLEP